MTGEVTNYGNVSQGSDLILDSKGDLYVADFNSPNPSAGIYRCRDTNGDGDAMDAGETTVWSTCPCQANTGGQLTLRK